MKHKKLFFCFRALIVSSLIAVGNSRWMVKNDLPDRAINKVEQRDRRVIAYLKGRDEKFVSLEKAVEYANNLPKGNEATYTVVLKPGTYLVASSFTIDSNIKLLLSFDGEQESTSNPKEDGEYSAKTELSDSKLLNCRIVLKGTQGKKTVITNKGIIEIGGELSGGNGGGNFAGQTAGRYSEILLSDYSCILNSGGTINCYGYIKEGSYDSKSKIVTYTHLGENNDNAGFVENVGGNFNLPFILRDYRGGKSRTAIGNSMDDYHVSPFNQSEIRNVTSKITFDYNSHVVGWANLRTSTPAQRNSSPVRLLGIPQDNGKSVFLMEPSDTSFKLVFYYNSSTEVESIDVYGGSNTNSMQLTVSALGVSKTITTDNVYFPLSFRQKITLCKNENQASAAFNMGQKFKRLAGAYLEVSDGVTLNADELCVYNANDFEDNSTNISVGGVHYPTGKGDAQLIVNGEFIVNKFGGYCSTESSSSKIIVKSSATITCNEAAEQKGFTALDLHISKPYPINESLSLNQLNHIHKSEFSFQKQLPIGSYSSVQKGSDFGFITNKTLFEIKYHHNLPDSNFDESLVNENGIITQFCGETNATLPTRSYKDDEYLFSSYYFDSGMTEKVDTIDSSAMNKLDTNNDLNIYVKWIAPRSDKYSVSRTKTIQNPKDKKSSQAVNGSSSKYLVGDPFSLEQQPSYELLTDLNPKESTKATETIKIFEFSGYSVVISDANGNQINTCSIDVNGNSSDGLFKQFQCQDTSSFADGYSVSATAIYTESSVSFTLSRAYPSNIAKGGQGDVKITLSDSSYKDRLMIAWASSNTDYRTVQSNSSWETKVTNKYVQGFLSGNWSKTTTVTLSCNITFDGTNIGDLKSGNITLQGK